MKGQLLPLLEQCVMCRKCVGTRAYFDQSRGIPPRGFGYPEKLGKVRLMIVLDQPHKMDLMRDRDWNAAQGWAQAYRRKDSEALARSVNAHSREAHATWSNEVHTNIRVLIETVFRKPFREVSDSLAYTNLMKCEREKESAKPLIGTRRVCANEFLRREIDIVAPRVLVSMGSGIDDLLREVSEETPIVNCIHPGKHTAYQWTSAYIRDRGKAIAAHL